MKGLIDTMYNLTCPHGHRAYAPNPKAYVGAECNRSVNEKRRCAAPLRLLTAQEKEALDRGHAD